MKIISIVFSLLILSAFTTHSGTGGVICRLELSVVKSKKSGQLISVVGRVENRTDKKFYFDGMKYLRMDIWKKEGKKDIDFYEGWSAFEMLNPDRDKMAAEIGVTDPENPVYDEVTGSFKDSTAKSFYYEQLRKLAKSTRDSVDIREWTKEEFDWLVFLNPSQSTTNLYRMNTLQSGSYKIVCSYSNVSDLRYKSRLPDLKLPKVLNGFERWQGIVTSDTLYFNVK